MSYTGDVSPGGPSDTRELDGLTIRKASVGTMDNNAYLLTSSATGDQILIDAADDPPRLQALVDEGTGELGAVVTTHQHWDHHRALPQVVEATSAATYAGAPDADALPVATEQVITEVPLEPEGDVHYPAYDPSEWVETSREAGEGYERVHLRRRG